MMTDKESRWSGFWSVFGDIAHTVNDVTMDLLVHGGVVLKSVFDVTNTSAPQFTNRGVLITNKDAVKVKSDLQTQFGHNLNFKLPSGDIYKLVIHERTKSKQLLSQISTQLNEGRTVIIYDAKSVRARKTEGAFDQDILYRAKSGEITSISVRFESYAPTQTLLPVITTVSATSLKGIISNPNSLLEKLPSRQSHGELQHDVLTAHHELSLNTLQQDTDRVVLSDKQYSIKWKMKK